MSLDSKYLIAPSLEMYFVDKDTGFPLAAGQVFFYSDVNRSVPKNVYTLSGSPPSYSYVSLPNPCILSSVGTFQDEDGNNVIPYYYPYDDDGNVELYYIEVFDSNGNPQFTREAWPNLIVSSGGEQAINVINYIPNGQFLLHNDIPEDILNDIPAGQIRQPVTDIAAGGWYFERPSGSGATDTLTFFNYSSYVSVPTSSPRYSAQLVCSGSSPGDAYKYLSIRFQDVNKFASDTDTYTFGFYAVTYLSGNFTVGLNLIKNFGTGGSPSSSTTSQLTTFNITNSLTLFQFSFNFGDNLGKSIGTNNDDYVELAIAFPVNITFGAQFTDFMLLGGNVTITEFPVQTNLDMITRTQVPNVPDYDGYDLYLPRVATPYGEIYDDSQVGMVFSTGSSVVPVSHLLCDGQNSYYTGAYSNDGIPYARLWNKLSNWANSNDNWGMAVSGTGPQYVTCMPFINASGNSYMLLSNNSTLAQSPISAGTTGFTHIGTVSSGSSSSTYGFLSYTFGNGTSIWLTTTGTGYVSGTIGPGTTSFSINTSPDQNIGEQVGYTNTQQRIQIVVNSFPTQSSYFQIANPSTQYYVWFNIDGGGTDPAPGGTGIEISITTLGFSDSVYEGLASAIANSLNGYPTYYFQTLSASSIVPNSYFTFYSNNNLYYVWFNLNGTGTDPNVSNGISIPVVYNTGFSTFNLSYAICYAINSQYYSTPDLRNYVIKGFCNSTTNDYNSAYRYSLNNPFVLRNFTGTSAALGSYQYDMILGHNHLLNIGSGTPTSTSFNVTHSTLVQPSDYFNGTTGSPFVDESGTGQNDVKNIYLNYVIKY